MKKFTYSKITLNIKNGEFISIIGNCNEEIYRSFFNNSKVNSISFKNIFSFKYNNVFDEINSVIKNKTKTNLFIKEYKLNNNIDDMSINDKIKLLILKNLLKNKTLIINNILNLLDINDYKLILKVLKVYTLKGNIVINITDIAEEILFTDRTILIYNDKLVMDDKPLTILNEEKLMKKIGFGIPFIVELNKYLMDYNLIDNYYLSNKKLVGALWEC